MSMKMKEPKPVRVVINTSTDPRVPLMELIYGNKKAPLHEIAIKHARLDDSDFSLVINHGDRRVPFKSRKRKAWSEKPTKMFEILAYLFQYRRETKKDNKKHDDLSEYISLENIMTKSGCATEEAVYQHIKRLNDCFHDNGLRMVIKTENGKCLLVVRKS